jgi:transcriptional regulator with XRE-family HTH domain
MAIESLTKFAEELKSAREARGLTLVQIASRTRIDVKFLQAIEDGNYDVLPELYIRAFIKDYAQTVDLNAKEILQKFDAAKSGKIEPQASIEEKRTSEIPKYTEPINNPDKNSILPDNENRKGMFSDVKFNYLAGCFILLLTLIIIYFTILKEPSPAAIQEKQVNEITESNKSRYEINANPKPQNPISSANDLNDSLKLSIITSERVWIKIMSDGKLKNQLIIQPNSKMIYTALKNFNISLGNAGVVKLFLNDKPIQNDSKYGQVESIFISPDSIRYHTISLPSKNEKRTSKKN